MIAGAHDKPFGPLRFIVPWMKSPFSAQHSAQSVAPASVSLSRSSKYFLKNDTCRSGSPDSIQGSALVELEAIAYDHLGEDSL